MKQNASAIYDSLHEALPSDQVKELQEDIKGIKEKASVAEEAIHRHLLKLREFLEEYGDLKSWLNDMNTVVQGEQHNIKRQVLYIWTYSGTGHRTICLSLPFTGFIYITVLGKPGFTDNSFTFK